MIYSVCVAKKKNIFTLTGDNCIPTITTLLLYVHVHSLSLPISVEGLARSGVRGVQWWLELSWSGVRMEEDILRDHN